MQTAEIQSSELQPSELQSIIKQKIGSSPYGIDSVFVAIDEQWGIKLYHHRQNRDICYDRQKLCEKFGYAPITGAKVDLPNGMAPFGYITEKVKVAVEILDDTPGDAKRYEWESKNQKEVDEVTRELREVTGWRFIDNHGYNWGYKNNKLIPIDFGD